MKLIILSILSVFLIADREIALRHISYDCFGKNRMY